MPPFKLVIAVILLGCFRPALAEQRQGDALARAQSMTFYSAISLHSAIEAQMALDSINAWKSLFSEADSASMSKLLRMETELTIGQANSKMNLNGQFPAYGMISGTRLDYHFIDDATESLAEELTSQLMALPSNFRKGTYGESGIHLLVSASDGNLEAVNVLMDLLNATTNAYVIRPHELDGLIPCALEDGPCLQSLNSAHWESILAHYNCEDLLVLNLQSKQEVSPEISYYGLVAQRVSVENPNPVFENYLEAFKTDKRSSKNKGYFLLIFGIIIALVILTLLGLVDYSEGKFLYVEDWKTTLHAKKNAFAVFTSVAVVYGVISASESFAPALNEYLFSPSSILWVLFIILAPPVTAILITYVSMWKLMKSWTVNAMANYSRLIQAAFFATYMWLEYYDFMARVDPPLAPYLMELGMASLFTLSPSWVTGKVAAQLLGGTSQVRHVALSSLIALVSLGLISASMLYLLKSDERSADVLHLLGFLLAVGYLRLLQSNRLGNPSTKQEVAKSHDIANPRNPITAGLNWNDAKADLDSWLQEFASPVFVIKGASGSGKTRFFKEWQKDVNQKGRTVISYEVLLGDFNQSHDNSVLEFEPFVEAFHSNGSRKEDASDIFKDHSHHAELLTGTLSTVAGLLNVPIPETDKDSTKGLLEVADKLYKHCEKKFLHGKRTIIILDNYTWSSVDEQSRKLLLELVQRLNSRPIKSRPLGFVLIMQESMISETNDFLLKEIMKDAQNNEINIEVWPSKFGWKGTNPEEIEANINNWLSALEEEIPWLENHVDLRISKKLKNHLQKKMRSSIGSAVPSPGDFLHYLQFLESEGHIEIQGNLFQLVNEMEATQYALVQGELAEKSNRFNELPNESKQLLISAAHIGFKFDAELLAEIWKLDLLIVLRLLDHPDVEGVFIKDQSHEDNIYCFTSRELHAQVKNGYSANTDVVGINKVKQIIVEFQKRVLTHILNKGDHYMRNIDLEVLRSTADDCIRFLDVEYIQKNTSKILLISSFRNLLIGNNLAANIYLKQWLTLAIENSLIDIDGKDKPTAQSDLNWLCQILDHLIAGEGNLDLFLGKEIAKRESITSMLIRMHADGADGCGGCYLALINEARLKLDSSLMDENSTREWQIWQQALHKKWPFESSPELDLEREFLTACSKPEDIQSLQQLAAKLKTKTANPLKGKVLRKLASTIEFAEGKQYGIEALSHELDVMHMADVDHILSPENLLHFILPIHKVFKRKSHQEGENYCELLESLYHNFKEQPEIELHLPDMMIEAGKMQGIRNTRNMGYSMKADALIKNGSFEYAEAVLMEYCEQLIKEGYKANEFLNVLERLLRLGKANSEDYSAFFRAKGKMYDSLRIIDFNLKSDIAKIFGNNIPSEEIQEAQMLQPQNAFEIQMTKDFLEMVSRIAIVDGTVDEKEIYDLGEIAVACCRHLGITSIEEITSFVNERLRNWQDDIQSDKAKFVSSNRQEFILISERLGSLSRSQRKQILRLCRTMAIADGVIQPEERDLLEIAEKHIGF